MRELIGPWPCEECGQRSQFADKGSEINVIYCMNETCKYMRRVDKRHSVIVENDGSIWRFDSTGKKWRIHARSY